MDRTQHVLDAIDGALDDWTVSGDAMRWTPEPAASSPRLFGGPVVVHTAPAGTDPADRTAWRLVGGEGRFLEQLGDAMRPVIGSLERAAEAMGMSVREFADHLAQLRPLAEPRPEPEDPKARALRLRQLRNTGPSRDLTRQRRPRLHTG